MSIDDLTVSQLLSALAARQPAPGGGSAAALAGAIAAALIEMAAAFARGRRDRDEPRLTGIGARAAQLRGELVTLADADLRSYPPVLAAMALPADAPERPPRLRAALSEATRVPSAVAAGAAELAELGAAIVDDGGPHLRGDVTTAVLLAEAAAGAAAQLVALNLASLPDDDRVAEARRHAARARAARAATARAAAVAGEMAPGKR